MKLKEFGPGGIPRAPPPLDTPLVRTIWNKNIEQMSSCLENNTQAGIGDQVGKDA